MKILLDECVTKKLKKYLAGFDVETVVERGWGGTKNGKLLTKAVSAGFDILLTVDSNMSFQQHVEGFDITLVVFRVEKSSIAYLTPLVPVFLAQVATMEKRQVYHIETET